MGKENLSFRSWADFESAERAIKFVEGLKSSKQISKVYGSLNTRRDSVNSVNFATATQVLQEQEKLQKITVGGITYIGQSANKRGYDHFYSELKQKETKQLVLKIGGNLSLIVGPVASFPQEHLALVVEVTSRIYGASLLEIEKVAEALFSESDIYRKFFIKQKSLELLLSMIHSFRQNQVLAMVVGHYQGQEYLLGSLAAKQGHGRRVLKDQFGNPRSSIPSCVALYGDLTAEGAPYMGSTPEWEVAEITRLFAVPREWLPVPDGVFDLSVVSKALMAVIHLGIKEHLPQVKMAVFNVKEQLGRVIKDRLHFPVVVACANPKAMPPVLDSIDGLYFRRVEELKLLILLIKELEALEVAHGMLEKLAGGT